MEDSRRVVLAASLLVAFAVPVALWAQPSSVSTSGMTSLTTAVTCAAGTCTSAAPALTDATAGLQLSGVNSWRVVACADASQTLSGAGTYTVWVYSPTAAKWAVNHTL